MATKTRRFVWNNKENGIAITKYINTMSRKYPKVARKVLRRGIGNLKSWFSAENGREVHNIKNAKCGCMVGTTALIAMEVNPQACQLVLKKSGIKSNAAELLFRFILASEGKYDPDNEDTWFGFADNDELLKCIEDAGSAAAEETDVPWGKGVYPRYYTGDLTVREHQEFEKLRHKEVVDHIEFLFKKKLGMVKPLRRVATR